MRLFYPFKAAIPLVATGGALASALSQPSPSSLPSPNNTISSPTSSPTASPDPNAPVCGAGFTYCGYILRDHKSMPLLLYHPLPLFHPTPKSQLTMATQTSRKTTSSTPTAQPTRTTASTARPRPTPSRPSTSASRPAQTPSRKHRQTHRAGWCLMTHPTTTTTSKVSTRRSPQSSPCVTTMPITLKRAITTRTTPNAPTVTCQTSTYYQKRKTAAISRKTSPNDSPTP
jgi:hypothetical protein